MCCVRRLQIGSAIVCRAGCEHLMAAGGTRRLSCATELTLRSPCPIIVTGWVVLRLEELKVCELKTKFCVFYGNRSFVLIFTEGRGWDLPWATWTQSKCSHCRRYILRFLFHLRARFPISMFHCLFPAKLLYAFPILSVPFALPCRRPLLPYWISTFCVLVVTMERFV